MWAIFVFCLCEVEVVLHKERPLNVEVIECGLLQVFAITGIIGVMVYFELLFARYYNYYN